MKEVIAIKTYQGDWKDLAIKTRNINYIASMQLMLFLIFWTSFEGTIKTILLNKSLEQSLKAAAVIWKSSS